MNAQRRAQISAQVQIISEAKEKLEGIMADEQEYYDNMPESIQSSEKGETAQEGIDQLQLAIDASEEALSALENIQ